MLETLHAGQSGLIIVYTLDYMVVIDISNRPAQTREFIFVYLACNGPLGYVKGPLSQRGSKDKLDLLPWHY
jgi:hypothetical protein